MGSVLVMKVVKPRKTIDRAKFRQTFYNAMRRVARDIKKDYEQTTRTWEHKPEFRESVSISGPGPILQVWTDDLIFKFVDEGTRPHEIWAGIYTGKSDKKALVFPGTFKAKTQPGIIGSGPGAKGGPLLFRPMVEHPGTKAREFSEILQKRWQPRFKREMEDTLKVLAKESGMAR